MSHLESGPDSNHNTSSLLFTDIPYPLARMSIHQWYTLVVGPVLWGAEQEHWLEEFVVYGCLGVRRIQEKKYRNSRTWSMSLAFKSQLHLHTVHAMLMSQANIRGLARFQVKDAFTPEMVAYIWLFEPRYVEQAIAWHRSQWDLQEMMKRTPLVTTTIRLPPMCRERPVSPVIERAWWKEHGSNPSMSFKYRFLENLSFPPCLSGNNPSLLPPHAHDRIRPMDVVSFDRTWLFDRLALIPISDIPPDLRHLEMIMRSHLEPPPWSQVKDFSVYMWPTNGPYDELIRRIAKWVIEDGGSCVSVGRSSMQRADETFSYRKDHWCLVLELQLDAP
ncbi:hypothetical protein BS47DRAFT_1395810 [Hydnum rufescens UP504]|uniref:Uncharacterized protein n=1 Tax=Hydnum rufescens UP504 TaxID=1448309 RepID=A0A9P6ARI7_9AGAM|nr:hypothetical protein BS47DRAFT_1395810 [Hydnum rufescens UP504]